ncbi:MAG: lauroyl acyltransferase [Mariprofundaceae bacterium]
MGAFQILLIRVGFLIFRLVPVRIIGGIGAGIGRVLFFILAKHRNIALRNLARIYPEKERVWRKRIARESFAELGRTIFELPHVFLRSKEFLKSRIEVEGEEGFRDAIEQGQGVFLTACHHSNWELGALSCSLFGYKSNNMYRPIKNEAVDKYLQQFRGRFGSRLQSRNNSLRWFSKALKNGEIIGIMIDQHMSQGIQVPFLGHVSNTTALPVPFIVRKQIPTFGVALERIERSFHFKLRFWRIEMPVLTHDKTKDAYHIMRNINESFTSSIHKRPELWLWLHRRWLVLEQESDIAEVVHGTP